MQLPTVNLGALAPGIRKLPIGLVVMDGSARVLEANPAAGDLGLAPGDCLAELTGQAAEALIRLCRDEGSALASLRRPGLDKPCRISGFALDGRFGLWVEDLATLTALTRQAQGQAHPERQDKRLIEQQAGAGLGYAELLGLILEADLGLAPGKRTALLKYHRDLIEALRSIQALAKGGAAQPLPGSVRQALVVDADPCLAELLAELLLSRGYQAQALTDGDAAVRHCAQNEGQLGLAVVDEALDCKESPSLLERLREAHPGLRLLALTAGESGEGKVRKPVDFNELLAQVEGLARAEG